MGYRDAWRLRVIIDELDVVRALPYPGRAIR